MPILKTRPSIRLLAPKVIVPGEQFRVEVVFDAKRSVDVEWVDVHLHGLEHWTNANSTSASRQICRLYSRVTDDARVEKGRTSFQVNSTIPGNAPPSYRGRIARVQYTMNVRASIDWWPDAKGEFLLNVGAKPVEDTSAKPRLYASSTQGPRSTEPHLELSLASDVATVGEELTGTIAFYNVAHLRYRGVTLSLVSRERLRDNGGRPWDTTEQRYSLELGFHPEVDGDSLPIRMRIPDDVTPSYTSVLWDLEWFLEVSANIQWRSNRVMRVPLRILPRGSVRALMVAPPSVGSERIATVWRAVGAALGLSFDGEGLRGRRGDIEVSIRSDHRGSEGVFLTATLSYRSVGLDLDAGRGNGLVRFFRTAIDLGDSKWADAHYATGREAHQVEDLFAGLRDTLAPFWLEDASDESIEVSRPGTSHSEEPLRAFANSVLRLADALESAFESLPPPSSMTDAVESWTSLARRLGSRLERGPMRIRGAFDGADVDVATEWSPEGEPLRTRITLAVDEVEESHRFTFDGETFAGDETKLPGDARVVLDALFAGGAVQLVVGESSLELSLKAPLLDAERLLHGLRSLATLSSLLRTNLGPYR